MTNEAKSANSAKIGKIFKSARQELNLTPLKAAEESMMNIKYLKAIESGDYSVFPSEGFAKAYFIKYQNFLSIECDFPSIYNSKNRENEIIEKSVLQTNPKLVPIFRITVIGVLLLTFLSIFISNFWNNNAETTINDPLEIEEIYPIKEVEVIGLPDIDIENINKPDEVNEEKLVEKILNNLVLDFFDECWIEIYSNDNLIINQLFQANDRFEIEIEKPFKIVVGNADALYGSYNDISIDFNANANRLNVSSISFDDE